MLELSKKKGFTLIEIIIALGLLSIVAVFLLPSLSSVVSNSRNIKGNSKLIFALEEMVETAKEKNFQEGIYYVNGYQIDIMIDDYDENLKIIRANSNNYSLEVVERK